MTSWGARIRPYNPNSFCLPRPAQVHLLPSREKCVLLQHICSFSCKTALICSAQKPDKLRGRTVFVYLRDSHFLSVHKSQETSQCFYGSSYDTDVSTGLTYPKGDSSETVLVTHFSPQSNWQLQNTPILYLKHQRMKYSQLILKHAPLQRFHTHFHADLQPRVLVGKYILNLRSYAALKSPGRYEGPKHKCHLHLITSASPLSVTPLRSQFIKPVQTKCLSSGSTVQRLNPARDSPFSLFLL